MSFLSRLSDSLKIAWRYAQTPIHFPMQGFTGFSSETLNSLSARFLPGSRIDFSREAGDLWLNSIVNACYQWQARIFPEAPFVVYKKSDDEGSQDENEIVKDHPLSKLIKNPNGFYSGTILWMATLLSLMVGGNSFWFVERSAAGMPIGLWWVPFWMVRPTWEPDEAGQFIAAYRYHVNGRYFIYNIQDFVHIRNGINPRDQRMGLSPIAAEVGHICTDNEWRTFSAAIARNMGIPGVVIKPPQPNAAQLQQGEIPQLGAPTVNLLKATWREKFQGDKAGMPLIMDMPLEVESIGFSPKELDVAMMRRIPEERITAALGIPAVVVGLGAGLAQASAKASHEDSQRQAYYGNIIPQQRLICEELDIQLLPDLGDTDTEFCGFDTSRVWFLKPDFAAMTETVVKAFQGGVLKLNEARKRIGERVDDAEDGYVWQLDAQNQPGQVAVDKPKAGKGKSKTKPSQPLDEGEDEE